MRMRFWWSWIWKPEGGVIKPHVEAVTHAEILPFGPWSYVPMTQIIGICRLRAAKLCFWSSLKWFTVTSQNKKKWVTVFEGQGIEGVEWEPIKILL
jgi:hypothetical protein